MAEDIQKGVESLAVEEADSTTAAAEEKPHPSGLSLEERFQLCRSVAEECVSEEELRRLLNKPVPVAYDGFEPSGAPAICMRHSMHSIAVVCSALFFPLLFILLCFDPCDVTTTTTTTELSSSCPACRRIMNASSPSPFLGRMHIAQGVMKAINVNRLTKAGCHFKFWVADWFAQLNNKMGKRFRGRPSPCTSS